MHVCTNKGNVSTRKAYTVFTISYDIHIHLFVYKTLAISRSLALSLNFLVSYNENIKKHVMSFKVCKMQAEYFLSLSL